MIIPLIIQQTIEEKFREMITNWIQSIQQNIIWLLTTVKDATITIGRATYGSMIIIGIVMWASGTQRYLSRKLIIGGSIIAIITELLSG